MFYTEDYLGQTTYPRPTLTEMISIISPGNQVSFTNFSSLLLFVQPDEKKLEVSTEVEETYFLTVFGNKNMRKITYSRNLHQNYLLRPLLKLFLNSSDTYHFEACSMRKTLDEAKKKFAIQIFCSKIFGQNNVKNQELIN